ncbi:MAG: hypothetical protein ACI4XJ_08305 [Eubacteriales bacterium]
MKNQKYSPPPGYDGNAFAAPKLQNDSMSEYQQTDYQRERSMGPTVRYVAKNEVQEDDADDIPKSDIPGEEELTDGEYYDNDIPADEAESKEEKNEERSEEINDTTELAEKNHSRTDFRENDAIFRLIESLHGKFGREELIILLVMFLVASDGICAEVLILALLLIAG